MLRFTNTRHRNPHAVVRFDEKDVIFIDGVAHLWMSEAADGAVFKTSEEGSAISLSWEDIASLLTAGRMLVRVNARTPAEVRA
jgi:hypothetical protein